MANNSFVEIDNNLEDLNLIDDSKSNSHKKNNSAPDNKSAPQPEFSNLIKGVYLLILAVMGNFIAETLGCKSQKVLSNNMFVKHIIVIIMIYFAIGIDSGINQNPLTKIGQSLFIWIMFVLFTKMTLPFTYIGFLILTTAYYINDWILYYKSLDAKKNADLIEQYKMIFHNLLKALVVVIIAGSSIYSLKQYNEHKNNFSLFKLIFGVLKCDSLK